MSHMIRLKALEQRVGLGGCPECHDEGGGGIAVVLPGKDAAEVPERVCRVCGRVGPPGTIIRVVYDDAQPVSEDAE